LIQKQHALAFMEKCQLCNSFPFFAVVDADGELLQDWMKERLQLLFGGPPWDIANDDLHDESLPPEELCGIRWIESS
jgi:hypothetical protein